MGTEHSEEEQMEANPSGAPGLKRSLSVWAAVGLSVALMAPSMAANINPQASATTAGRAVPLTFLIAAVGVLLVAYSFVRLCQYFHHSGSVYAFVGATLGPRAGVVAGWGLLGTYTFYAVVTSSAAGIFGTAFLQAVGIWPHPPSWAPFILLAVALALTLLLAIMPARRGAGVLAMLGCTMLVFVRRKLPVPMWQVAVPIAALIVLGYTLYRNVIPYPTGAGAWFPVVSGAWLAAAIVAVIVAPGTARKLGAALAAREGIAAPGAEEAAPRLAAVRDEAS